MAEAYYSVYGWMPKELHISGNELHVFALIYCFTENCGQFSGSAQYIADQTGMAKRNVFRNLQKLTEKKLLQKQEDEQGICYRAGRVRTASPAELPDGPSLDVKSSSPPVTNRPSPDVRTSSLPMTNRPSPDVRTSSPPVTNRPSPDVSTSPKTKIQTITQTKEDSKELPSPKNSFGEYGNVRLTEAELDKLKAEFPEDWRQRIERLSAYMASTGKAYKNHLATIRSWAMRDTQDKRAQEKPRPAPIPGGLRL